MDIEILKRLTQNDDYNPLDQNEIIETEENHVDIGVSQFNTVEKISAL